MKPEPGRHASLVELAGETASPCSPLSSQRAGELFRTATGGFGRRRGEMRDPRSG
jgi:hypothetical protein